MSDMPRLAPTELPVVIRRTPYVINRWHWCLFGNALSSIDDDITAGYTFTKAGAHVKAWKAARRWRRITA